MLKRGLLAAALLASVGAALVTGVGSAARQAAPTNVTEPRITGTPVVGRTLTATQGTWSGSPTSFSFRWVRCPASGGNPTGSDCTAIAGATTQSYEVSERDVGRRLRVRVTATNADGSTTVASNATELVRAANQPTNTSPPTISGSPNVGSTLTANPGTWTGSNLTFAYSWRRCDQDGGSCAAITWALYMCGEKSQALREFEQNLELARRLGHQPLVSRSIAGVCQLLVATGEFERAEPLALELHASTRETEDVFILVAADHYLSDCAMDRSDYTLAEEHRLRALETALRIGDVMQQTIEVLCFACAAAGLGRDEDAVRLEGAVAAKWKELGVSHAPPLSEAWRERDLVPARVRLGEPRATAAFDEGRAMTWDQAIELALAAEVAPIARAIQ